MKMQNYGEKSFLKFIMKFKNKELIRLKTLKFFSTTDRSQ